jgi:hypothetical protein
LQQCIPIPQGRELLRDIHAGVCGHHSAPRTLVGNTFHQGFYWPTAVADASEIVRTCEGCQFYARKTNLPAHALQTIPVTRPFAVWGLDIVGPLRKAPGGYTHLLIAIDKLSMWVEACPITNLRAEQAVTFFTDIIYRFGVPNSIIMDNGSQFTGRKFLEFYDKFHIRVDWGPSHIHRRTIGWSGPSGMILQGLKPRIFDRLNQSGRKWLQELPAVVWSLRATPSRATGFTPFFLVYGAEAVLPTDLEYGLPRVKTYDEGTNQRAREDSLDQLDEARTVALMHSARYQRALRQYQSRMIRRRLRRGRPSRPKAAPRQPRPPQAIAPMGGTLHRCQSAQARHLQAGQRRRRGTHQRLEHPIATSLPPLRKDFQASFVIYIPNTPVGDMNVNFHQINKTKG